MQTMATTPESASNADDAGQRRTILLIGGTGFVGDRMRHVLREQGNNVRLLTRSGDDSQLRGEGFETTQGNVTDPDSLVRAMQGVDVVINLVAVIKEKGDATFERVNYQGSVNMVDAARQVGVRRLIQMSALGAGNLPEHPYHYTKWRAENYVRDSGLDWTIFRPSIVFGPGEHDQFVSQLADIVKQAPVIPVVGDGKSRFQPVHLDDVSEAFARAVGDAGTIGQTFDLGGAEVLTYEEILDECAAALGKHKRKVHVPTALMMPVAALMGLLPFIDPPVTTDQLRMLKLDNTTEDNATARLIGRDPLPFRGNIGFVTGGASSMAARQA